MNLKALPLVVIAVMMAFVLTTRDAWAMAKRPPVAAKEPKVEVKEASSEVPVLELRDLIEEALQKNPELYAYQERWKAAKARIWKAASWDDTMIGADFEGIPRGRIDADRKENIEWMISQKIPFPGKRFLRARVARKEAKMAEEDYHGKEREIISEVKKAYFEYFLKEHEILLHEETKRILERLSKSAESRYATAKIPYHEVLRAHTELATMTNEVAKHYQERDTALARLNSLLGREAQKPLRVAVVIDKESPTFDRDLLAKLALENRPELRAVRYGLEAARTDAKRAWVDLLPDGQVRLEARQFPGEGRIREYDQFFGFEVPVFSLLGRVGEIKEKRAESRAAKGAYENMRNMVLYEVQKVWAEYESNERTVRLYASNVVPQAESIVDSLLADYETGRSDFMKVMEAQKALTEFRHHYFEALAMREASLADLERIVGVDLSKGGVSQ
ncbi:MAG: TolC family protein [Candidatus Omnitrophica bacterium]|nr:TolC family protein [Candidatus Omnitrophota bacterium]